MGIGLGLGLVLYNTLREGCLGDWWVMEGWDFLLFFVGVFFMDMLNLAC